MYKYKTAIYGSIASSDYWLNCQIIYFHLVYYYPKTIAIFQKTIYCKFIDRELSNIIWKFRLQKEDSIVTDYYKSSALVDAAFFQKWIAHTLSLLQKKRAHVQLWK